MASKRSRSRPTALLSISHHSAEPISTPSTISAGELLPARPAIEPKMAMKEKMVAGFDSVSTKVLAKYCQPLRAGAVLAARSATGARNSCQAIQSRKAPPNSASGTRAATRASTSQLTP